MLTSQRGTTMTLRTVLHSTQGLILSVKCSATVISWNRPRFCRLPIRGNPGLAFRQGKQGSDFHRAFFRGRQPAGDSDRFVEVVHIDDIIAAELFSGFSERTIGDLVLAIAYSQTGGTRYWMQRR